MKHLLPSWPRLFWLIVLFPLLSNGTLSAHPPDTTDWALVLVGPTYFQSPANGAIVTLEGAYLLGTGDTTAQVAEILRYEERLAYLRPQRAKDRHRLHRLGVMLWREAFQSARKIVVDPLPLSGNEVPIHVYDLNLQFSKPGRGQVPLTLKYYLLRIPISVLSQAR